MQVMRTVSSLISAEVANAVQVVSGNRQFRPARSSVVDRFVDEFFDVMCDGVGLVLGTKAIEVKKFEDVKSLRFSPSRSVTPQTLHAMAVRYPNVTTICLDGVPLTCDHIQALTAFKKLTTLSLQCTQIKDSSLLPLAQSKTLRELNLSNNRLHGTLLHKLPKTVVTLELKNTNITDNTVRNLKELPSLQDLTLSHNALKGSSLVSLPKSLEGLKIDHCKIEDSFLSQLMNHWKLKALDVSANPLSGTTLYFLPDSLKELDCSECPLRAFDFPASLEQLKIPAQSSDAVEKILARCPHLNAITKTRLTNTEEIQKGFGTTGLDLFQRLRESLRRELKAPNIELFRDKTFEIVVLNSSRFKTAEIEKAVDLWRNDGWELQLLSQPDDTGNKRFRYSDDFTSARWCGKFLYE